MPDESIQGGEQRVEARPFPAIVLPALEHQRVEGRGAVVGGRETILICNCLHHLQRKASETLDIRRADGVRSLV